MLITLITILAALTVAWVLVRETNRLGEATRMALDAYAEALSEPAEGSASKPDKPDRRERPGKPASPGPAARI